MQLFRLKEILLCSFFISSLIQLDNKAGNFENHGITLDIFFEWYKKLAVFHNFIICGTLLILILGGLFFYFCIFVIETNMEQ